MLEFLKKLCREEVPATVQEPVQEPKPEAPKVLTDDEKLIIKAIQKSDRFEAHRLPTIAIIYTGEYSLDDAVTIHVNSSSCSLFMVGDCVACTRNEYGIGMIAKAISERIHQDREEKRNKLNEMLG